jgi:hypothetical protein
MRKLKFTLLTIFITVVILPAKAVEKPANDETEIATSGFFAGGQASTNGLGFNVKYILNKRFTLKTGYETLGFSRSFEFDENDIEYAADLNYNTGGLFLLADFYYTPGLYISGGVIFNKFQPELDGRAIGDLNYGDIVIPASEVGDFNFYFEPEIKTSPYLAIGFRKFSGKAKRVSYHFETGLYFMGNPDVEIETTGLLEPTSSEAHGQERYLEEQFSAYKYYPVVKFDIAVRLF